VIRAMGQKSCRDGFSVFYIRSAALFRYLALARPDGSLRTLLARLSRIDVLVIDDWVMAPFLKPNVATSGISARTVIKLARPS
jgi:DNA replication protein DnaC